MANHVFLAALLKEVESAQQEMNGRMERIKAAIEQEQRKAETDEGAAVHHKSYLSFPKTAALP